MAISFRIIVCLSKIHPSNFVQTSQQQQQQAHFICYPTCVPISIQPYSTSDTQYFVLKKHAVLNECIENLQNMRRIDEESKLCTDLWLKEKKIKIFYGPRPIQHRSDFFMYLENTISLLIVDLYGCSQAIGYASSFDRFSNSNDVSDIHKRIVKMRWELRLWKAVINRHIETLNRINFICI